MNTEMSVADDAPPDLGRSGGSSMVSTLGLWTNGAVTRSNTSHIVEGIGKWKSVGREVHDYRTDGDHGHHMESIESCADDVKYVDWSMECGRWEYDGNGSFLT